jgi:hypothetical protein
LKEDIDHDLAVRMVKDEYKSYKKLLEHNHTKFKIVDEKTRDDGSIVVDVKKQLDKHDIGDYF